MASVDPQLFRSTDTLLERHQQLRAIFNQAAVGIALASLDGHFIDLNRRFSEILGYSEAELHAMTFSDLTHPDDREITVASVRQLLAGEIPEYTLEKRYLRKGGGVVWSLTTVTLMRDSAGRPLRFIGVIEDITQRKNAEAALHEERRILEILNETGKLLASQLDLQSLVQAVTDAATKLSGAEFGAFFYNVTDEHGDAFLLYTLSGAPRELFANLGNPRATALFGPTFRGGPPIRLDDVLGDPRYGTMAPHHGMPKGHLPVRSYLAVPVKSRSGEVIGGLFFGHSQTGVFTERAERLVSGVAAQAGIAIDNARLYEAAQRAADERTALLESERAARSAAERLSEVKDEFLATLSHELRTPLNAILGWSQVLRTGRKNEADIVRGLETIDRNARVQAQLIEDLLDMSRINSGNLLLEIGTADPAAVIDAAIETVRPAADGKGIRISRDLDPAVRSLPADPGRLQQVIWNLLSNAIKFTPRDGEATIATRRAGANLEISVTDTGIGIAPDFLPYLFERFRQGDSSTTRRFGGLGLGLSIVKSLVEMHGGSVSASSKGEGHGTTITVQLPLRAPARAASEGPSR
jgi:PAS domain S-box-containing protein